MATRESRRRRRSYSGGDVGGSTYKKAMSRQKSVTVRATTTGAMAAGGDLGAAAGIVADKARELASAWSRQVPASIRVEVRGNVATISSQVGPAYPNEIAGVRHPTFGHDPWVTNQHRPFLAPAADASADKAMARYANKIDGWARKAGYR